MLWVNFSTTTPPFIEPVGALMEMLREMKESNEKLQEDVKRLSEKIAKITVLQGQNERN